MFMRICWVIPTQPVEGGVRANEQHRSAFGDSTEKVPKDSFGFQEIQMGNVNVHGPRSNWTQPQTQTVEGGEQANERRRFAFGDLAEKMPKDGFG